MQVWEKGGAEHTAATLEMALTEALRLDARMIVATTGGATALAAMELLKAKGELHRLVIVTHAYGTKDPGCNRMPEETFAALRGEGVVLVTAAHALSGAERAMSSRFGGAYPVEIIAHTLRMLSQGVKVAVEISAMALDAGTIPYGKPCVAVGGTGRGADTAAVVMPAHTQDVFATKIVSILCKPGM